MAKRRRKYGVEAECAATMISGGGDERAIAVQDFHKPGFGKLDGYETLLAALDFCLLRLLRHTHWIAQ